MHEILNAASLAKKFGGRYGSFGPASSKKRGRDSVNAVDDDEDKSRKKNKKTNSTKLTDWKEEFGWNFNPNSHTQDQEQARLNTL